MNQLGQYRIIRKLGAGAMGEVYLAEHELLRVSRALKVLPKTLSSSGSFRDRFLTEGQVLARLHHPHIVRVHDMGVEDNTYYIAMDFVSPDGKRSWPLDMLLAQSGGHLSPGGVVRILLQVCQAIAYAHNQGVVHCDIKPANILVVRDNEVCVTDFGLAKIMGSAFVQESLSRSLSGTEAREQAGSRKVSPDDSLGAQKTLDGRDSSQTASIVGTFHYMPPEVQQGLPWTRQGDIYSLGVLTYVLLTGELPQGRWKLPSELNPGLSPLWDGLIVRALEKNPDNRFASVKDMLDILRDPEIRSKEGSVKPKSAATGEGDIKKDQALPEKKGFFRPKEAESPVEKTSPGLPRQGATVSPAQQPSPTAKMGEGPESEEASKTKTVADSILRWIPILIAPLLLASLFLPFFPKDSEMPGSNARSVLGLAITLREAYPGVFVALLGMGGLGILIALSILLKQRSPRGFYLLFLSTSAWTLSSAGVGALLCYPHPLLSELTHLLGNADTTEMGVNCFVASLLLLHVLALLHLRKSKAGVKLWLASLVLVTAAGGGAAALCLFVFQADPQIFLRELKITPDGAAMEAHFINRGNVPFYLKGRLEKYASRNSYLLELQRSDNNTSWTPVSLSGELALPDGEWVVAAAEESRLTCEVPFDTSDQMTLRAQLHNSRGLVSSSQEISLTKPIPEIPESVQEEAVSLSTDSGQTESTIQAEQEQQNAILEELRRVTESLSNTNSRILVKRVADLRTLIDSVEEETERERLHGLLDDALLESKDREATALYERAFQNFQSELYEKVVEACQNILSVYQDPPPVKNKILVGEGHTLLLQTQDLLNQAQLALDPNAHYQVTGIFHQGEEKASAFLSDRYSGSTTRISEGDDINGWKVLQIHKDFVILERGGREITLKVK